MISSRSLLCLLLGFLVSVSLAKAGDEKEPYKIRIVLVMARHRLLTKVFEQQVGREVKDGLQAALGDLAQVRIKFEYDEAEEKKRDEIRKYGLGKPIDKMRERSAFKTHFVKIDLSGAAYAIQTRQYDGVIGVPSPVIRRDRTSDRAFVGRTAALLIEKDLGLLGTVDSAPDKERVVSVNLKGGRLGVDLSKWIKKDEVFALVRGPGVLEPWAVLQVVDPARDGVCRCRFYSRYRMSRVRGLRCVLLGTRKGSLRLRLMQEMPGGKLAPLDTALTVQIRHNGFEGEDATRIQVSSGSGKDIDTSLPAYGEKGIFNKLAFVSLLNAGALRARIPVPVIDDSLVILPATAGSDEGNLLAFRVRALQRTVLDAYRVQIDLFNEINELTAKPDKRAEALARVRKTLERCEQDHLQLATEREEVGAEVAKAPMKDRTMSAALADVDHRLKLIKAGEKDLVKHLALLQKIEKEENDPKRKEWLIQQERAKALIKEAELGQAIAIYEKAPAEFMTAALKKHIADLKKKWDGIPAEARRFIYKTWPALNTITMEGRVKEALDALDKCKKAGDIIGPVKLRKTTDVHVQRMLKELEALRPDINLDDEKPAKRIEKLTGELKVLLAKIDDYLEKHEKD